MIANNPSSSQTEDAVRGFVTEVSSLPAMTELNGKLVLSGLLTKCQSAGLRGLGEVHDESILRRQSGNNEPNFPQ